MIEGFDPSKSRVSEDAMELWRNSFITGELDEVPGIGPAAVKKLANHPDEAERIVNTYQLFGHYLKMKGELSASAHNEAFWYWLKARGVTAHRSAIVLAIAEKANSFFPGLFDPNDYCDDAGEDDE